MRSSRSIWLSLTQLALLAGCSGQLPLEVPDRAPLPTEFAGSGAAGVAGGSRRGRAGSDAMTSTMRQPGRRTPVCGDGVIEPPAEACDRSNLNGATCASLGYSAGGVLLCNPTTCNFDTIMCRMRGPTSGEGTAGAWSTPSGADAGTEDAG